MAKNKPVSKKEKRVKKFDPAKLKRPIPFLVRLNEKELQELIEGAEKAGVHKVVYARCKIFGYSLEAALEQAGGLIETPKKKKRKPQS